MAEITEIKAEARPRAGKGAARSVRREGKIPGVIYGDKKEPETIAVDHNELWILVKKGKFTSTLFDIKVDGKTIRVLPRDVQLDPVKDLPIHVDFLRIGPDSRIRVDVPVRFINDAASPGLKRGGVLNIVRHEVEVFCPAGQIPEAFEFDLTGLEIGRSIHISAIQLPPGVKPTIANRDFTVATIAGRGGSTAEAATAGDGAGEGAEDKK
ncbi:MAG: ribosomal protein [Pseudomonadota bacterium]|jgi:large subunit ribosomal protein L25